jgi:putative ABC transport system permease protein
MVSLGSGLQVQVKNQISSLGSNLIIVFPGSFRQGGIRSAPGSVNSLTLADATAIQNVDNVAVVAPTQRSGQQVIAGGLNWSTTVQGVTPAYLEAKDWDVASGRMFEDSDDRGARKVAVLGQTVVTNLFPNTDPVGQTIRIHGGTYQVIGTLTSKGQAGFGQDQDDVILAPLTTVKRDLSGRQGGRPDQIQQITVKASSESTLPQVTDDVTTLLRQRHHTTEATDDFTVQNLSSITDTVTQTMGVMTAVVSGIAGISLLVGGIGIMNIMLVSVTERTREIGLRKALGARKTDILNQFGLEAIALSVAGGLVGLVLGILIAWGITPLMNVPLVISPTVALIAIGFSAFVGVVFGSYPAWRAAQLDPIEALRRE